MPRNERADGARLTESLRNSIGQLIRFGFIPKRGAEGSLEARLVLDLTCGSGSVRLTANALDSLQARSSKEVLVTVEARFIRFS